LLSEKSRWITGQNVVIDGGKSRTIFFNWKRKKIIY
jgi:hypothetical protein